METQLAVLKEEQFDAVIKNSGLEIQEGEQIKQSYQPFLIQIAEIHEQSKKINWDNPAELDETIARNLRLKTVKIRTDSEKLKDSRKRSYLLRGNLEQACYNLIAATCKVAEDDFTKVEKAREIAEAKRIETLRVERTAELLRYGWVEQYPMYNVGKLDDQTYNAMLAGLKKTMEDRIAEEKRIEAERIAAIKKAEEERLAMIAENKRLRKDAEEKEKALAAERAKAEAERKAAEEKARKEREVAAKKLAEEQAKADIERKKLEAEAKRLADELRTKQLQEEAERQRKAKEETDRIAAEKQAAAAPDKEKLLSFANRIIIPAVGELKSPEAQAIYKQAAQYITNVVKYVKQETEKL